MLARHAVLLTRLECAVPSSILYSKQNQPVTSLESALTSQSQLVENTATLSLVECALTRLSPATPLECAVPKKLGGGNSFFPFRKQSTPSQPQGPLVNPERSRPKIPTLPERATHHSPQYSSSFFSLSSALFPRQLTQHPQTTPAKPNVSALFAVTTGVGTHGFSLSLLQSGGGSLRVRQPLPSSPPCLPSFLFPCPTIPLPPCFLTSLPYNRCACIGGRNEFQPASRRNRHRLRAPLLGRQYYRTLRACLILWRAGRSGHLSPRSSQVFRRAGRRSDRLFRSCRVVSADSGRQPRGPLRVPPLSRLRLPGSGFWLLSLGFARGFVDGPVTICSPLIVAGAPRLVDPRARSGHREALCGGNHGSRFQGKCSFAGLLHLLHARQCWRNSRSHRGVSCAAFNWDGKCLSRLLHERPAHVFRCSVFLPRTITLRRAEGCQCRRSAEEYVHRARQFAFHAVPSDFFGFLDCVLAGVYYAPPLHTRLCQPELGRRLAPHLRPSSSHSPSDPGELSHAGNQDVSSHDVWIAHHQPCVDH